VVFSVFKITDCIQITGLSLKLFEASADRIAKKNPFEVLESNDVKRMTGLSRTQLLDTLKQAKEQRDLLVFCSAMEEGRNEGN